jgi:threonine dehydratase
MPASTPAAGSGRLGTMITRTDVEVARARIAGRVRRTPLLELDPAVGVVVASGGNAGLANAFAARALGVPATVFVPTAAPAVKVAKLRRYGAEVVLHGAEYAAAYEAAIEHAERTGAVYCHAYDQVSQPPSRALRGSSASSRTPSPRCGPP